MTKCVDAWGMPIRMLTDLYGKPVERTPFSHPYSFDPYVIWKSEEFNINKIYSAEYSDRMLDWDIHKFEKCTKEVFGNEGQFFNDRNPEDIEKFLIKYLGHDLKLIAIEKCCNFCNGYPYWIFYYENLEENDK